MAAGSGVSAARALASAADSSSNASAAFLKKKAEDPSNRQIVTDALRQLAGGRWRIGYELREDLDVANGDGASRTYTEEEWIERFKSELDAEEIPLEPEPAPASSVAGGESARGESRGAC